PDDPPTGPASIFALLALLELSAWAVRCKHPSFSEEREWRIVTFGGSGATQRYEELSAIEFRVSNELLVPYVRLIPRSGERLPIVGVICGPGKSHQQLVRKSVEILLEKNGYSGVPVTVSDTPARL